jgi:hypothetical protein
MQLIPELQEIQALAETHNKDIFIDVHSLSNFGLYPVLGENNFVGFVYIFNGKVKEFGILNNNVIAYALTEGFKMTDIYKYFDRKLFSFYGKEEFLQKLLQG